MQTVSTTITKSDSENTFSIAGNPQVFRSIAEALLFLQRDCETYDNLQYRVALPQGLPSVTVEPFLPIRTHTPFNQVHNLEEIRALIDQEPFNFDGDYELAAWAFQSPGTLIQMPESWKSGLDEVYAIRLGDSLFCIEPYYMNPDLYEDPDAKRGYVATDFFDCEMTIIARDTLDETLTDLRTIITTNYLP